MSRAFTHISLLVCAVRCRLEAELKRYRMEEEKKLGKKTPAQLQDKFLSIMGAFSATNGPRFAQLTTRFAATEKDYLATRYV